MLGGKLVAPLPSLTETRQYAAESVKKLPTAIRSLFDTDQKYRVECSTALMTLYEKVQNENGLLRHRHAD